MSKRYFSTYTLLKTFVFLLLTIGISSCYKNKSGCLDILASNYSIGADDDCNACCTYPKMLVKVTHSFNGEDFQLGKEYTNNIGSIFKISEQQFFISSLSFFDDAGKTINVRDSIKFTSKGVVKTFVQDFNTIRATVASAQLGSAKYSGNPSKVTFKLGLSDQLSLIDSVSSLQLESLIRSKDNYIDGKYQSFYFKLTKVGVNQDITISTSASYPFTFDLSNEVVKAGAPLTLNITINYADIFADISFPTMTNSEINSRVLVNIQKAISYN